MAERGSLNPIGGNAKDRRGAGEEKTSKGNVKPIMPHFAFSGNEATECHPPLVAPEDDLLDDPTTDLSDHTLQAGLRLAEGIRGTMRTEWRR